MSLLNKPTCDCCGGIDLNDLLVTAYDEDIQKDMEVCPDCLEEHGVWLIVKDPGGEIDHVMTMRGE